MSHHVFEFVKAAVRNPLEVSTVFPTSKALAQTLLAHADLTRAERVVEVGAGTGAITKHLLPQLPQTHRYLGIELDSRMVSVLRRDYSDLRFEAGLAEHLSTWTPEGSVDVVVSSLPWSLFSDEMQENTISAISNALRPGGVFVTYICLHAMLYPRAVQFVSRLQSTFADVYQSPLEWRNIPPAYVFKSTKA